MKKFYFTFGFGHYLISGAPADKCYTIVEAESRMEARLKMHEVYGPKWSFCYDSPEEAGVHRYGLRFVDFGS